MMLSCCCCWTEYWSWNGKALPIDDYIGRYDGAANEIEVTTYGDYHPVITGERIFFLDSMFRPTL